MRGWMKALLLAVIACAAAAACARTGDIAAPENAGPQMDDAAPAGTEPLPPADTSGRWGGFIGGGG